MHAIYVLSGNTMRDSTAEGKEDSGSRFPWSSVQITQAKALKDCSGLLIFLSSNCACDHSQHTFTTTLL